MWISKIAKKSCSKACIMKRIHKNCTYLASKMSYNFKLSELKSNKATYLNFLREFNAVTVIHVHLIFWSIQYLFPLCVNFEISHFL